jgi:hypothetical protein
MGFSPDHVGILLPDQAVVLNEAIKAVRHIVRASPKNTAADWIGWKVEVVSADEETVLSLPFDKVAIADDLLESGHQRL